ncbi:MAG: GntR family transcriptional regulator [Chloroflexi bacterium]|nr:GntR family transcriptional regulator [Chloroflexota bacterium]
MMSINRSSPIPLYRQLYALLRSQIEAREYKTHDALPTEEQLAEKHAVSRVTVRKALQILADDGLIVRQSGKGTFVYPGKIAEKLNSLQGFAEMMAADYPAQVMAILSLEVLPADSSTAEALNLEVEDRILRVKRLHAVEKRPVAYAVISLPFEIGKLLTPHEMESTPIYTLLMRKANIAVIRANQRVTAVAADSDVAHRLNIAVGAPVLTIERVTYAAEDRPVELIQLFYPGGQHELVMELYRDTTQNTIQVARQNTP